MDFGRMARRGRSRSFLLDECAPWCSLTLHLFNPQSTQVFVASVCPQYRLVIQQKELYEATLGERAMGGEDTKK